jgi:hypothetical protein
MPTYTIKISEEEEKALLTDMISVQDWLDNAIKNKIRRCMDEIVKQVATGEVQATFTPDEEAAIKSSVKTLFVDPKQLPDDAKKIIVKKAHVKSARDREKEAQIKMAKEREKRR